MQSVWCSSQARLTAGVVRTVAEKAKNQHRIAASRTTPVALRDRRRSAAQPLLSEEGSFPAIFQFRDRN